MLLPPSSQGNGTGHCDLLLGLPGQGTGATPWDVMLLPPSSQGNGTGHCDLLLGLPPDLGRRSSHCHLLLLVPVSTSLHQFIRGNECPLTPAGYQTWSPDSASWPLNAGSGSPKGVSKAQQQQPQKQPEFPRSGHGGRLNSKVATFCFKSCPCKSSAKEHRKRQEGHRNGPSTEFGQQMEPANGSPGHSCSHESKTHCTSIFETRMDEMKGDILSMMLRQKAALKLLTCCMQSDAIPRLSPVQNNGKTTSVSARRQSGWEGQDKGVFKESTVCLFLHLLPPAWFASIVFMTGLGSVQRRPSSLTSLGRGTQRRASVEARSPLGALGRDRESGPFTTTTTPICHHLVPPPSTGFTYLCLPHTVRDKGS
ncbi:Immunoglobulin A1 protease [Varanus komodoensis]|nr:Immunoglobulin A1 protease [Varanus komodoensis]